jgi:hypothetical protein
MVIGATLDKRALSTGVSPRSAKLAGMQRERESAPCARPRPWRHRAGRDQLVLELGQIAQHVQGRSSPVFVSGT